MNVRSWAEGLGVGVLVLAFGVQLVIVALEPPGSGRPFRPGEATTWAQAASFAHDLDFAYSRADYDRLVTVLGGDPEDLELVTGSGGRRIGFDRPFPYALWTAPFVLLSPHRGVELANVVALLLALGSSTWLLRRRIGGDAVVWTLALLLGTTLFSQALRGGVAAQATAITVVAATLAIASRPREGEALAPIYDLPAEQAMTLRWALVGAVFAVPVATFPVHLALVPALWTTPPAERRSAARRGLVVGLLLGLVVLSLVRMWTTGGLPGVGTSSHRFTAAQGFPDVDFPAQEWDGTVRRLEALHADGALRWEWSLHPRLVFWNAVDFLLGREVGLLLVSAPAVLLLLGRTRPFAARIGIAAILWTGALLLARPFRFHGAPESLGNELVLPALGLLWPLAATRIRPALGVGVALVCAAVMAPVWMAPAEGRPGAWTGRLGTVEVAQRSLGEPMTFLGDRHARILSGDAWIESRRDRLMLDGNRVELLLAGDPVLDALVLVAGEDVPTDLEIGGAARGDLLLRPDGGYERVLRLPRGRRLPMWWGPSVQSVHVLELRLPEAPTTPLPLRFLSAVSSAEPGETP